MKRVAAAATAALLLIASSASAGQKPSSPEAAVGEEVFVTHTGSGQPVRGRMLELSPTSMTILVDGKRVDVPVEDVLRIDIRGDSVKDGAIIGAAVAGILVGLSCAAWDEASHCIPVALIDAGFGALVGAGIDALHKGRTPIYIKAGKSTAGLQLKFSW